MVSSNVVSACVLFILNSLIYSYVTADDLDNIKTPNGNGQSVKSKNLNGKLNGKTIES